MSAPRAARSRALLVAGALAFQAGCADVDEGSPSSGSGRVLYASGASLAGREIRATILGGMRVPGKTHPCAQCHGASGAGAREAGATVPNVRWHRLTSAHGVSDSRGRRRPAYTEESFARALRDGVDPTGRAFSPAMPRYEIEDRDLADLISYLRVIDTEDSAGVTPDGVSVAALLPLSGPLAGQGRAVEKLLERFFQLAGEVGPIHGRRVSLVVRDSGETPAHALEVAQRLLEGPRAVFCFVASGGPGAAPEVLDLLAEKDVPVIGPLTFAGEEGLRESVFSILSSLPDQARAIAHFVASRRSETLPRVALVSEMEPRARAMADAFQDEARKLGIDVVPSAIGSAEPSSLVERLRDSAAGQLVLLAGSDSTRRLLDEASRRHWSPHTYVSAVLSGPIPKSSIPLHVVVPPAAPGIFPGDDSEFFSVSGGSRSQPPATSQAEVMAMAAFAAAKLLVYGLRETGRELRPLFFTRAIEKVRDLETGVLPAIRFGPGRRAGTRGALFLPVGEGEPKSGPLYAEVRDA